MSDDLLSEPQPDPPSTRSLPTPPHRTRPAIIELLTRTVGGSHASDDVHAAIEALQAAVHDDRHDVPFLSVILRTQGRRPEPLADALLCLSAQTDRDFELILVEHGATAEESAVVRELVDQQPESFRSRITVLEVNGGARARPINEAVRASSGRYISVFDDDDLLFADWVEQLHLGADQSPGRMIRVVASTQWASPETWRGGHDGFRSESWPRAEYAPVFDTIQHLRVNHSPFMSWAFPRWLFTAAGLSFDEELDVCEDWDLILRGSNMAGVESIESLAVIYRRWRGAQSSYTDHQREEWARSERRVVERMDAAELVLPPSSVERLRWMLDLVDEQNDELHRMRSSITWRVSRRMQWLQPVLRAGVNATRPLRIRLRGR